jgi:L,D-peptidoglycan transpeptidase YkuD (ErfK/YbiS/YcfS/YnhG family)
MTVAVVSPDGWVEFGSRRYRAALGRGGVRADKREGDGATPAGMLPLRRVLFRADRVPPPRSALPREPIAPDDAWCDDVAQADYNRLVRLPHSGRHEALWRADSVYDVIGVLGWNDMPVERGRGSAIFVHNARPDFAPTEGCVALEQSDLVVLLADGLTALHVLGLQSALSDRG